jgi:phage FluMu gp28-like protein
MGENEHLRVGVMFKQGFVSNKHSLIVQRLNEFWLALQKMKRKEVTVTLISISDNVDNLLYQIIQEMRKYR